MLSRILCDYPIRAVFIFALLMFLNFIAPVNAQNLAQYHAREQYHAALAAANPQSTNQKLGFIMRQLISYSGKSFPVTPAQTGNMGRALQGGGVMIDLSVLAKRTEISAFWLAHEWGHQDMGHLSNPYSHPGRTYNARMMRRFYPTSNEDQADAYAGQFLGATNYDIRPVLSHICSLPPTPANGQHSSLPRRAMIVATAYSRQTGRRVEVPCG